MKRTTIFGNSKIEKGTILESYFNKSDKSTSNSSMLSSNDNSISSITKNLSKVSVNSEKSEDESPAINKPYPYQEKVFEMIKDDNNSIIFMETGKGKTLISIMLIGHILNFDVFKRSKIKPQSKHKKIVFLVCEVALVDQQKLVISQNTSLTVEALSSRKMKKLKGDIKKFRNFWDNCDVFVSTHQIIYNLLSCGYIKIFDIDLLIFDECHHMDGNHPYNIIMNEFYFFYKSHEEFSEHPGFKLPKILGLTASPLKKKIDSNDILSTASKALIQLCENMDAVMVIDPEVLDYKEEVDDIDGIFNLSKAEVKREFIEVEGHKTNINFEAIMKIIQENLLTPMIDYIFDKEAEDIKDLKNEYRKFVQEKFESDDFYDYNKTLSQYGYLYELRKKSWMFSVFEKIQINMFMILMNLNSKGVIEFLDMYRKYFEDLKCKFDPYSKNFDSLVELHHYRKYPDFTPNNLTEFNTIIKSCLYQLRNSKKFETNRLEKLLDKIGELFESNKANEPYSKNKISANDHRLIIFVENRIVSDILSGIISTYVDETINCNFDKDTHNNFSRIQSVSVVGVAKKQCDNSFYPKNSAIQINQKIKKFTEGSVQIMVCTNTIEEGIDVKACDAVIVFTELKTTKSYIQMKGRARKSGAKFCIFSPDSQKTIEKIKSHVLLIIAMRKLFDEGIVKDFRDDSNMKKEEFHNYFVKKTHAKLTLKNVAQFFNELFQILNERYKKTIKKKVVFYEEKEMTIKFKAVLKLECDWLKEHEKEIKSELFNDKASAENFCFLIFLILLHKKKIIDDNFQIA